VLLRFGVFELDPAAQELRRGGVLIKLSPQQLRVLRILAERGGQVCTREEIQREIWGTEVYVDFDRALNVCVAAIRSVLNDDSEASRFIQTVPRQGYRFVAPVEQVGNGAPVSTAAGRSKLAIRRPDVRVAAIAVGIAAALTAGILLFLPGKATRLAVLPFENLSGNAADTPVAAGLTDELTTQLGLAYPIRLAVVGRTSAARYASRKAGLDELGVDYLIEGSVQSESGQVRVAVRLVEARGQTQVWSNTFQGGGSGKLEMQERVAAGVAGAVVGKLFPKNAPLAGPPSPVDSQAAEAYWNGRYLDRRDPARAIEWFTQAASLDPKFAAPRAAMAETWLGRALSGPLMDAAPAFQKAGAAARDALKIEETNAEAHAALGTVMFWYEWNPREARRHFEAALNRNPSLARAHHDLGFLLVETGATEAGLRELHTAIGLDPVAPRVNLDAGWVFLQARRFDDAVRYARRALELEPRLEEARLCVARAVLYQGKGGSEELEKLRASANPYYRAMGAAMTGRPDQAIVALGEAMAARSSMMVMIGTEPAFDTLRGDPRFKALVTKVGMSR
jgi:DNA-binding winged helix-turn-helix (wHTH) protein/TolB-like protein/tetratricopeptide (TPR) repeat protein